MTSETSRPLQRIFTDVPPRYDLVNRLFTFRLDERWRKTAARECLQDNPEKIMDLCTGTGDLAIHLANRSTSNTQITGVDFSTTMLEVAEQKKEKSQLNNVQFVFGDAANLPFKDEYFDVTGISFAFRNLTFRNPDTPVFLKEILRTLKKGGKFVIIESSIPKNKLLKGLLNIYMNVFVQRLGTLISGNKGAYKYFAWSVTNFYTPAEIQELLLKTGFSKVDHHPFLGGFAAMHVALK